MRRLAIVLLFAAQAHAQTDIQNKVDAIFAKYANKDSPGCAVGVARNGNTILERGYGMANLEYDIPITPSTIFEAGSVSKQFTAAAVLLLEHDGKLSLDDRVRKYIPELNESAKDVTIRQILSHTSGLRDWGSVSAIGGWPRGSRRITHAMVLDILSRQRELNFAPGTQWSYSNSGYNLAAMLVERVSGKSFPDFVRERIFTPLQMTHSSWRDDYTRVVKGRATAYDPEKDTYVADMDVENIYGNCCLLTTVGDLLKWSENFGTATVGGKTMIDEMETPAVLANGKKLDYGFGLFVRPGEIFHSGATAGYRAFLSRRLSDGLTVAVLCNRGDAPTGSFVEQVTAAVVPPAPPQASVTTSGPLLESGLYRDMSNDGIFRIINKDDGLHMALRPNGSGPRLSALTYRVDSDGVHVVEDHRPDATYVRVADANVSAAQLAEYAGTYFSDEVPATYDVRVENGKLTARVKPGWTRTLDPTYADAFVTDDGDLMHFTRDAQGHINGFDMKASYGSFEGTARVERLHFVKR